MSNTSSEPPYQPLIIIGAGRSGTNILRDTLCQLSGFDTWPCDEINLIWRHGNVHFPTDRFDVEQANPKARDYIKRQFDKFAHQHKSRFVVEKTCANSLRLPFINAIFPDAKFIYIVRDGRDVTVSALRRWKSSIELHYLVKKLKYVPLVDIPTYAVRFALNRLHQFRSGDGRMAVWGPRFAGMQDLVESAPLDEVCAAQWVECVETFDRDSAALQPDRIWTVKYESFVQSPKEQVQAIVEWLRHDAADQLDNPKIWEKIKQDSIGNWQDTGLSQNALERLKPTLQKHAYL